MFLVRAELLLVKMTNIISRRLDQLQPINKKSILAKITILAYFQAVATGYDHSFVCHSKQFSLS